MRKIAGMMVSTLLGVGLLVAPAGAAPSVPRISHVSTTTQGTYAYVLWRNNAAVTNINVETDGRTISYGPISSFGQDEPGSGTYRFCVTPFDNTTAGRKHCTKVTVL